MNKKRFYEYCESFNSGEKEKAFDEFYTQDARFEHSIKGVFKGKSEIVGFWRYHIKWAMVRYRARKTG